MPNSQRPPRMKVRTLFLSDVHLGLKCALQGQLEVHREWVHRTARGEPLLIMHGDQLDGIVSCAPWLTKLGDAMYDFTVMLSHSVNNLRRAMQRPYWLVAERIKLSDWVESCSALVEKHSGELELLRRPHAAAGVRRPTAELLPDAA